MNILSGVSLLGYNTFGIDVKVHNLFECNSVEDVLNVARQADPDKTLVVGGGSNMLFLSDYDGTVVLPRIKGIDIINETESDVVLRVGAGVIWDDFVRFAVQQGWHGIENLSGIPGTVGASPVQNVGAYGVEAGQFVDSVEFYVIGTGERVVLSGKDCCFGYRDSIFKHIYKGKVIVAYVNYRLFKHLELKLDYGPVREAVLELGEPSLMNVRNAILAIRNSKLPDPKIEGNAGSFFKNPEVERSVADALTEIHPDMPRFELPNGLVKIPAGWLIERSGWKGKALGPAAVHDRQALVLVNKGGATGADVMRLADTIRGDVLSKFGIELHMEVCLVP